MLVLDRLTYRHPGQASGYEFSMDVAPGEVTAVSGASGSGKSTLLDLIAGFLKPSGGAISLDGKDLIPLPPESRPISILFQSEMLFEHLTATRNIALGLKSATGVQIEVALTEVGLPDVGKQRADTLSGGQKQRVALARTLLRDKPVLLLDEPFSALDDETRAATRNLVQSLTQKHKWATVLVTHHADDIAAIADRVYLLAGGVLTR